MLWALENKWDNLAMKDGSLSDYRDMGLPIQGIISNINFLGTTLTINNDQQMIITIQFCLDFSKFYFPKFTGYCTLTLLAWGKYALLWFYLDTCQVVFWSYLTFFLGVLVGRLEGKWPLWYSYMKNRVLVKAVTQFWPSSFGLLIPLSDKINHHLKLYCVSK